MQLFWERIIGNIGIADIVDILIVAFITYKILGFIQESRAEQLVKGLIFIVALAFISELFNFYALGWLVKSALTVGVLAIIIIFQPELRRALEFMGRAKIVTPMKQLAREDANRVIDSFIESVTYFAETKTGALIVIERETALEDIIETGTKLEADLSTQIIESIFYKGTALHDGAVIVRGDKLISAGCMLPLTQNMGLPRSLGTRHRAAIGVTEMSDAFAIIVSEETGAVSVVQDGEIDRNISQKSLKSALIRIYFNENKRMLKMMQVSKTKKTKGKSREKVRRDNAKK
ncbi:MAG: diadenylate cyclase CdaA [Anaerovoracaceae bacterium]